MHNNNENGTILSRDFISNINKHFKGNLSFKTCNSVYTLINKAKMLGMHTVKIDSAVLLIDEHDATAISNKFVVLNGSNLFHNTRFESIDLSNIDTHVMDSTKSMFSWCETKSIKFGNIDTSHVESMENMFEYSYVDTIDFGDVDTHKVKSLERMFTACRSKVIDLSKFDMSSVDNMNYMFTYCRARLVNLNGVNLTNVKTMSRMFLMYEGDIQSDNAKLIEAYNNRNK